MLRILAAVATVLSTLPAAGSNALEFLTDDRRLEYFPEDPPCCHLIVAPEVPFAPFDEELTPAPYEPRGFARQTSTLESDRVTATLSAETGSDSILSSRMMITFRTGRANYSITGAGNGPPPPLPGGYASGGWRVSLHRVVGANQFETVFTPERVEDSFGSTYNKPGPFAGAGVLEAGEYHLSASVGSGGLDGGILTTANFTLSITAIPEPSTALLVALGVAGIGVRRRVHQRLAPRMRGF